MGQQDGGDAGAKVAQAKTWKQAMQPGLCGLVGAVQDGSGVGCLWVKALSFWALGAIKPCILREYRRGSA